MAHLRIGSRGSQLALWQSNHISALLRERGHSVEIQIIHTTGDKITDVALAKVGTKVKVLQAYNGGVSESVPLSSLFGFGASTESPNPAAKPKPPKPAPKRAAAAPVTTPAPPAAMAVAE